MYMSKNFVILSDDALHLQMDYTLLIHPKFPDTQVWANSVVPDQIASRQLAPRGAVWSGSTLFAIPSASFECKATLFKVLGDYSIF